MGEISKPGESRVIVIPKETIRTGEAIRIISAGELGGDPAEWFTIWLAAPPRSAPVFRETRTDCGYFVDRID